MALQRADHFESELLGWQSKRLYRQDVRMYASLSVIITNMTSLLGSQTCSQQ